MSVENFRSTQYVAQAQREELIQHLANKKRLQKERRVLLGYFVVAMLATLLISGALQLAV